MSADTLYWILSTLPQVIAALTGLLLTATTFVYQNLDKNEKDVVYDFSIEIIEGVKKEIHKSTIRLLVVSIVAIIYDVVWLAFTSWISWQISAFAFLSSRCQFWIIVFWLALIGINTTSLLLLIMLLRQILDPEFKKKVVVKMSKIEKAKNNEQTSKSKNDDNTAESEADSKFDNTYASVSPEVLIQHFRLFERSVRQYKIDNHLLGQQPIPLRAQIRKLADEMVIPKQDLNDINHIIKLRNLYLHEGDIGNVSKELDDKLLRITQILNLRLPAYRREHQRTTMEDVFLIWIDENVEDLKDAYELLQAIQLPNTQYGSYYVSEDNGIKYLSSNNSPATIRIYNEKGEQLFKSLLENRFAKNGESIEDQYNFSQALDKDDLYGR